MRMSLFKMSLSGAVIILAVLIVRALFINRLPKKTFVILWEIVLVRLLLPFTVPSVFSVYTLANRSISTAVSDKPKAGDLVSATMQALEQPPESTPSVSVWFVIWCVGMILCASFFVTAYLRCRVEFQTALPVSHPYAAKWLQRQTVKRRLSIRQSEKISTPLTYGIWHPVILMPKDTDWEDLNLLQYILSH